ncbi:cell division cycle protein 123 homolog [Echinops telfairi]|uniref:Translation initiation factor eIF2 assembly protein n=1 Tax=Echinops telfairi TaxID=9371 RepID=A0ABM0J1E2_ECHTE|nr:cell division cycle protein 123 homolog [Echinops telfairi]
MVLQQCPLAFLEASPVRRRGDARAVCTIRTLQRRSLSPRLIFPKETWHGREPAPPHSLHRVQAKERIRRVRGGKSNKPSHGGRLRRCGATARTAAFRGTSGGCALASLAAPVELPRCQRSSGLPSGVILPLPQNVKDYLLDDGTLVVSGREDPPTHSQPDSDDEAEEIQWSDDENTATLTAPEFPEFTTKVQEAVNLLGGSVFPKLNWSAPRDAYWIAMNSSLKCKTLSDIFLLFKSSDFITRDFTQPFIHCTDDSPDPCMEYELVLRKWCELIPGAEFRCFVKENKLIGISQRDYTQYYDHIFKQKEEICRCIQDFFKKHIQYKFLDEDFVFDIYRDSRGKVWLIDFNPFGEVTDSLLFTWEELISGKNLKADVSEGDALEQDSPAFRCTNSEVTVQPSPYLSYRLPKDFVDLSTGEDAHKLIDFLKLKRNQQEDD